MNTLNFKDKRFLIVDYIKHSSKLLQTFAYSLGTNHVDTCHLARDVISKCQILDYDVILLGYNLGDDKRNGQQVLEQLRRDNLIKRQTIIIILTAEISQEMVLACLEHKPDDYIAKPYTFKELSRRLGRSLNKKKAMHNIYEAMDSEARNDVISYCDQLLEKNTKYKTECLGIKSRQLYNMGQYKEAQEIYVKYLNNANCQWAAIGLGKIALASNEFEKAVSFFKDIILENPSYLPAYDWLAKAYQLQNDLLSAESSLEQALKVSPRSLLRLKNYAELCLSNKNYDKSTSAFYKTYEIALNSIHHQPENILLFVKSLLLYADELQIKDIEKLNHKAINGLRKVNKEFSSIELKTQTKLLTARLFNKVKKLADSHMNSQQAVELLNKKDNLFSVQGLFNIIDSVNDLDITEQVLPSLKRLSQAHPDNIELHREVNNLAKHPISDEDIIKAKSFFNIGNREFKKNRFIPAIKNLQRALTLFPDNIGTQLTLLNFILTAYEKDGKEKIDLNIAKKLFDDIGILSPNSESQLRLNVLKSKYQMLA